LRIPRWPALAPVLLALCVGLGFDLARPGHASGQSTPPEGDGPALSTTGYLRAITLLHDRGYDLPTLPHGQAPARQSGVHGQLLRLKWRIDGDGWRIEAHPRIQLRISSEAAAGPMVGFGVGAEPERLLHLRSDLITRERVRAWHDVDRLSLTFRVGGADLTLGRQPITWGTATLFQVADLWAAFSPFEQDTDEKPGIDAARLFFYPGQSVEMDVVVAHRGRSQDLSLGTRATISRPGADLWVGAGKFWRQLMAMGGVTVLGDHSRWRAEAVLPWDMDQRALQPPRVTLGVDRVGATRILGMEYHFNGLGAADPDAYVETALDPRLQRGESYFLGRHYLGGVASWNPDPDARLTLAGTTLINLGDGSLALSPGISYDVGQAARISVGGLLSFGGTPTISAVVPFLHPRTEFGLYGNALFTTLSVYF
jgi:hypothetical protein